MKKYCLIIFIGCIGFLKGQVKQDLFTGLSGEDSTSLVSISVYADSIRSCVLEASKNPELLIEVESLQKNTSLSFRSLMDDYNKEVQKKLWNLTRYPGLIDELGKEEKKSKESLEKLASSYPVDIRQDIIECGRKNHDAFVSMKEINAQANENFEKIIAGSSEQTKEAFKKLIRYPDAFNELVSNMHFTVVLGNSYSSNPKQTVSTLDSIRNESIKQNAKNFEDWKAGLNDNPEAKKEMEQAAKEFEMEQEPAKYVDDVYNTSGSTETENVNKNNSVSPTVNYVVYSYPYWYGYPWWFDFPNWYPYPYWYNYGFYYGASGIVYVGMPSPYFMHWYFFHPYHHYYYSYFSDYCIGYHSAHYGPRVQHTGFSGVIYDWRKANEPHLPKGFLNADPKRHERIKELGKFEMDYHNSTKGVFGKNITREEFLKNNPDYYPKLVPAIKEKRMSIPIKYPKQKSPVKFEMDKPVIKPAGKPAIKPAGKPVTPMPKPKVKLPRK